MAKRSLPPKTLPPCHRIARGSEQMGNAMNFVWFLWLIAHPFLPQSAKISSSGLRSAVSTAVSPNNE